MLSFRNSLCLLITCTLLGCGVNYKKLSNAGTANQGIICLGDSITRGYGSTKGKDYPSLLEERLGTTVVNAGVDGNTSAHALKRLQSDVISKRPQLVIIMLGGNDVLQRIDHEETLNNIDKIVAHCVAARAMVVLVHARYGLFSDPYLAGFKEIAKRHKVLLVKGALKGILGTPAMSSDQIHPNNAGYALLADRIGDAVVELFTAINEK